MVRPIIFGKYCLLERISIGGMAEVYRARPFDAPDFDRFLVVKRILPNLAEDDEFIKMFVDEAKIAVQLNHPNICQIYELGRLGGAPYIVMEHIAGKDLLQIQNHFRRNKRIMAITQAAYVIEQVCEGLDYAHRKTDDDGNPMNIVHRDISPQNILISYGGGVKLIDFGIAKAATKTSATQVGVLKGKFGYMSPEQVSGKTIDYRSDIFAVGTLFWELLTARRLFYGDSDFETLERVRHAKIPPPSKKNDRVPAAIDEIVLKALVRDRGERYQSAGEMAAALRAFRKGLQPTYDEDNLEEWIARTFRDELEEERSKRKLFAPFVTVEDVREHNAREFEEMGSVSELDIADVESVDQTQVIDPERDALPDLDLEGGDILDEILAENELEPIATVVTQSPATGSDSSTGAYPADPGLEPPPARRGFGAREWGLVLMIVLSLVGIGGLSWVLLAGEGGGGADAQLIVTPTPSEGVAMLLDGQAVDGEAPFRVTGVAPGAHEVALEHPEYEPWSERVNAEAGEIVTLAPTLEPLPAAERTVVLTLEPDDAYVYVNGAWVAGQGARRTLRLPSEEATVLEIRSPGFFVETIEVPADADDEVRHDVALREVKGTLDVSSQPPGTVIVDGEERGTSAGSLSVDGLDPRVPHALEIQPLQPGFRSYERTLVFDTFHQRRLRVRLRRIGETEDDADVAVGYLVTTGEPSSVHDWYRIFLDGRDSGFTTPMSEDAPLAVEAGTRTVEFVRARRRYPVVVNVTDGAVTRISLPEPATGAP